MCILIKAILWRIGKLEIDQSIRLAVTFSVPEQQLSII
jgi:hypothetical protein